MVSEAALENPALFSGRAVSRMAQVRILPPFACKKGCHATNGVDVVRFANPPLFPGRAVSRVAQASQVVH